jgi:uncharacterized membrane protein YkvA (DUF1232 family)
MTLEMVLLGFAVLLALYALFVAALLLAGRPGEARAVAAFVPDCIVLLRRLLADEGMPRSRKAAALLLIIYLAMPFDLIPDFIPVLGQLDDAILVALVLRFVLRGAGPEALEQHWPGTPEGARLIEKLAFGSPRRRRGDRGGEGPSVPADAAAAAASPGSPPPPDRPPCPASPPKAQTTTARRSGSSSPE